MFVNDVADGVSKLHNTLKKFNDSRNASLIALVAQAFEKSLQKTALSKRYNFPSQVDGLLSRIEKFITNLSKANSSIPFTVYTLLTVDQDTIITELSNSHILPISDLAGNENAEITKGFYQSFYNDFRSELQDILENNEVALTTFLVDSLITLGIQLNQSSTYSAESLSNLQSTLSSIEEKLLPLYANNSNYATQDLVYLINSKCELSMDSSHYADILDLYSDCSNDSLYNSTSIQRKIYEFSKKLPNDSLFFINTTADFAIVFYLGLCLPSVVGKEFIFCQNTNNHLIPWDCTEDACSTYEHFKIQTTSFDSTQTDIALCIEPNFPICTDVKKYISAKKLPIKNLVTFTFNKCDSHAVKNGTHARQLVNEIKTYLNKLDIDDHQINLHLFVNAPSGLIFFLGQESRFLKNIHFYNFKGKENAPLSYEELLFIKEGPYAK